MILVATILVFLGLFINYDANVAVLRICEVEASWNMMAHAQKPDSVYRWNGRVHLNWRGRQFSRLLAPEVCASAVVMLDTQCSEVVWRALATHPIRQFPLPFPPPRASPCTITFQLESRRWLMLCLHFISIPYRALFVVGLIIFPTAPSV